MSHEDFTWTPPELAVGAAQFEYDKARFHSDSARDAGRRAYVKVDAIEHLFGIGVAAELRTALDDVTEHASEAIHYFEQNHTAQAAHIAGLSADIADRYKYVLDLETAADENRVYRENFTWLSLALEDAIASIERSAKRASRRVPPIVGQYRKALAALESEIALARERPPF